MFEYLLLAAAIPVLALCYFIYSKDTNREPVDMLLKLLGYGALTIIPIVIGELMINSYTDTENVTNFFEIFIKVFIGVALFEEGFKWLVVKNKAYNSREFDEIYDIIVYSVFVSLGFALIENILYVIQKGFAVAILRALLSVPGHACFAVMMGFFLSKAKVASINNNNSLYTKNIILSLLVPMLFHTMYDAILFYYINVKVDSLVLLFLLFDIIMVVICFITVNRTSKVQQNLTTNIKEGNIIQDSGKIQLVETANINYCPLCGTNVRTGNFCPHCGLKIR